MTDLVAGARDEVIDGDEKTVAADILNPESVGLHRSNGYRPMTSPRPADRTGIPTRTCRSNPQSCPGRPPEAALSATVVVRRPLDHSPTARDAADVPAADIPHRERAGSPATPPRTSSVG